MEGATTPLDESIRYVIQQVEDVIEANDEANDFHGRMLNLRDSSSIDSVHYVLFFDYVDSTRDTSEEMLKHLRLLKKN